MLVTPRPATIVLSDQEVQWKKIETVSNNLSNTATSGFKALTMKTVEKPKNTHQGETISYVAPSVFVRDTRDGPLKYTLNPLDVALRGQGYFITQTPDGKRYTRAGQLTLDSTGRLVNDQGHPILNEGGGDIVINSKTRDILMGTDGTLTTEAGVIGKLGIVKFDDEQQLKSVGYGLYDTQQEPISVPSPYVIQGAYEESNTEPIQEVIKMVTTLRHFEEAQRIVDLDDERQRKVINVSPRNNS
ncbi:MAG: flagellar hook basal-body protein [Proteobacteria bacterium]|nr:flagellar hook basal-body protein [Pseudomonadota bacterium]